jgi:hypothetical protein
MPEAALAAPVVDVEITAPDIVTPVEPAEVDWKAEAEKWKTDARKHEERAKKNAESVRELEKFRQQSMTDQEKAIDAARSEGRAEALRTSAAKVVDAEVRAAAAGRTVDVDALLEGLDRSRFIDDDGEVDAAAIAKWIERVAPVTDPSRPDLGQGVRPGSALPLNGDGIEQLLRSKLGIR